MTATAFTTINLRGSLQSPGLYARKVWQVLFNEYRNGTGDLEDMDSLLCDLFFMRDIFERDLCTGKGNAFVWEFDHALTAIVEIEGYTSDREAILVVYSPEEQRISFYRGEQQ